MATTTSIHVTACDNELHIYATTPAGSSEVVMVKSGYNNPVNYTVTPQSILPPGAYTLVFVGINWGGPGNFTVVTTAGGVNTTHTAPSSSAVGVTWSLALPITV
jgi:hypothetical protein